MEFPQDCVYQKLLKSVYFWVRYSKYKRVAFLDQVYLLLRYIIFFLNEKVDVKCEICRVVVSRSRTWRVGVVGTGGQQIISWLYCRRLADAAELSNHPVYRKVCILYCVSKRLLTFDHNVDRCRPIFKILSLTISNSKAILYILDIWFAWCHSRAAKFELQFIADCNNL